MHLFISFAQKQILYSSK